MLLQFFRRLFSKDLLVELSEDKISISAFSTDLYFEDEPYIAIEKATKKEVVLAIGKEARDLSGLHIKVLNPFKHHRSFVASFIYAEKILTHGIFSIHKKLKIKPSPRIIMHQLEKTEGGLTDIEERVLHEIAIGAGAREVIVYVGERIDVATDSFDAVKARVSAF